jgi:hypothetical protein
MSALISKLHLGSLGTEGGRDTSGKGGGLTVVASSISCKHLCDATCQVIIVYHIAYH